jgi:hypothetical protein
LPPSLDKLIYDINLLPERIRNKIAIVGGCWIWTGYVHANGARQGYGRSKGFPEFGGPRIWMAHRLVYRFLIGPIKTGYDLDHLIESGICKDSRCCNPAHLEEVTRRENTIRYKSARIKCLRGHLYAGNFRLQESSRVAGRYGRVCKECRRQQQNAYMRRKRASIIR